MRSPLPHSESSTPLHCTMKCLSASIAADRIQPSLPGGSCCGNISMQTDSRVEKICLDSDAAEIHALNRDGSSAVNRLYR